MHKETHPKVAFVRCVNVDREVSHLCHVTAGALASPVLALSLEVQHKGLR
jgi:hypothetical protein